MPSGRQIESSIVPFGGASSSLACMRIETKESKRVVRMMRFISHPSSFRLGKFFFARLDAADIICIAFKLGKADLHSSHLCDDNAKDGLDSSMPRNRVVDATILILSIGIGVRRSLLRMLQ